MNEDKIQILKMIEKGTITAEEGVKLLDAISDVDGKPKASKSLKWVRVSVWEPDGEKMVDVKLPSGLFKIFGSKLVFEIDKDVDIEALLKAIREGVTGELLNITSADGHRVIVTLE